MFLYLALRDDEGLRCRSCLPLLRARDRRVVCAVHRGQPGCHSIAADFAHHSEKPERVARLSGGHMVIGPVIR